MIGASDSRSESRPDAPASGGPRWLTLCVLAARITSALYLARCAAARRGVDVRVVIAGWLPV